MTTTHHPSRLGTHPQPVVPRSVTDLTVAALCKVLDGLTAWTRYWRRDEPQMLDVRLSADPDRKSCIVGVVGAVDENSARDLALVLHSVRGYSFVSIDLTGAVFNHPNAQLRFDEAAEQLEFAGAKVVVSGARDDMGNGR